MKRIQTDLALSASRSSRRLQWRLVAWSLAAYCLFTAESRADLILDLRADDPTHINVVGGKVVGWTNEAAPGQVFTSNPGQEPTFVPNAINGLPAVQFNGLTENDVLRCIGFGETASNMTVFMVAAPSSNPGGYRGFLSAVDQSTPGHQDYTSGINIDM